MLRNRVKDLRIVKAANLVPHEVNWRTHSPEHLRMMCLPLKESGIAGAIPNQPSLRFPRGQIENFIRASAFH
jgi:hypothetical protein